MTRREQRLRGTSTVSRLHQGTEAFDREFWADTPASERLEAVWGLVLDYLALTDPDGREPRLQRSVCRVERRRG